MVQAFFARICKTALCNEKSVNAASCPDAISHGFPMSLPHWYCCWSTQRPVLQVSRNCFIPALLWRLPFLDLCLVGLRLLFSKRLQCNESGSLLLIVPHWNFTRYNITISSAFYSSQALVYRVFSFSFFFFFCFISFISLYFCQLL